MVLGCAAHNNQMAADLLVKLARGGGVRVATHVEDPEGVGHCADAARGTEEAMHATTAVGGGLPGGASGGGGAGGRPGHQAQVSLVHVRWAATPKAKACAPCAFGLTTK